MSSWTLSCSACGHPEPQHAGVGLCPACAQPFLAIFTGTAPSREALLPRWDMWRYAPALPLAEGETPVSLGEGLTPLTESPVLARAVGVRRLWIKDEGVNPTASFKARGLSAAVTRARARGVPGLVVPTAGNAGAALAAYAAHDRIHPAPAEELPDRIVAHYLDLRGQAEALERAVQAGSDCAPILQQLAALRGAVHGLMADMLDSHVRETL
ncbi:MAG: pyridoxal-phosphate dependent enzyme, partial [Gemmatimonadota bacterium]